MPGIVEEKSVVSTNSKDNKYNKNVKHAEVRNLAEDSVYYHTHGDADSNVEHCDGSQKERLDVKDHIEPDKGTC